DVSPTELKRIADVQYAGGVNLMCQHLYPYSERGQRKRDYPLHYSDHCPWQESMIDFDWYYNRLGAALAEGTEYAPILVVHPIHGAYMSYKKGDNWHEEIDSHFAALSDLLGENQIPYHYGDENMMKRLASVEGDKIRVGLCTYDAVIIPFTYSLDHETCDMLQAYMANGGKIWLYKDVPGCVDGAEADLSWLQANITFDDLLAKRDARMTGAKTLRKQTRLLEDGSSLVYITNIDSSSYDCVAVDLPDAKTVCEINLETMELEPVHGEGTTVYLRFEDAQSHLLLVNGPAKELLADKPEIPTQYIPVPEVAEFASKPENMITLDMVALSKDGVNYDEPLSVYGVKDNLLREQYNGRVWLKFTFTAADDFASEDLRLVVEPMGQDSVTINGVAVQPDKDAWWFDRSFASVNIAPFVKPGENEIIISLNHYQQDYVYYVLYSGVSESLRNCLVFDTEIECIYLVGDFAVKTDKPFITADSCKDSQWSDSDFDSIKVASFAKCNYSELYDGSFILTNQKDSVCISDVVQDGYPFFGGTISVQYNYNYAPGAATVLALTGRFATCRVLVNGQDAGEMMFIRHLDLSQFLVEGDNQIVLQFSNAMRNLMGPHHRPDPEPFSVGPTTFSFEKEWNGRECKNYADRYAFVKFGVKGVK
ncbi:MAG: hypothetical protein IJ315_09610, partial [Firmicutes bacterium]|nr:hypothetical protein [Bacillota bacterium]